MGSIAGLGRKVDDFFALEPRLDLNRPAADLAILHKLLPSAAAWIEPDAQRNTAMGAGEGMVLFDHILNSTGTLSVPIFQP